jgi:transcriptional regulator with XRE-family HTH domain
MDGRTVDERAARRFGANLLAARRRAGRSQEELAALCGLHRTSIGLVEQGRRLPRVDTLIKLAGALGVEVEELLRGIEWFPPPPPVPPVGFVVAPRA